jgi:hypothetical protein
MVWSRRLPKPIYLNDGRTIHTLGAARDFILAIPPAQRASPHWRDAAEVLLKAAYRGRHEEVQDAGRRVSRALQVEGLA